MTDLTEKTLASERKYTILYAKTLSAWLCWNLLK